MSPELPDYVLEWMGQRVEWPHGPLKGKQGVVTDVTRHKWDNHWRTRVNVLRDDGFLEPVVPIEDLAKIRDGNFEAVKVDVP